MKVSYCRPLANDNKEEGVGELVGFAGVGTRPNDVIYAMIMTDNFGLKAIEYYYVEKATNKK
jgi:hypothetical protein